MDYLNSDILLTFQELAQESPIFEVGAFVTKEAGTDKLSLFPCKNSSATPESDIVISADQYADAEDQGELVAFLHSHPGDGARAIFSPTDKQGCHASGMLWGVMATETAEWAFMEPDENPLIGRPFVLGLTDCYGMIMAWHETQGITIPDYRVRRCWWESGNESLYMDNWQDAGFVESDFVPGAVAIMQVSAAVPNHAGIVTENGMLLHHLYGHSSCVTPFARGYFRERVIKYVRHKDLPAEIKAWK